LESFILGLSIAFGCLQCFFGYRSFKTVLLSTGFLLGLGAGSMGFGAPHYSGFHSFIGGIVGGLFGASLMSALYLVGLFILGASLGGIIEMSLFTLFQSPPHPVVLGILAMLLGIVTVKAQKFMIIFATAFEGAWLIVMGMALLLQPGFFSPGSYYLFYPGNFKTEIIFPLWLFLGIGGFMYQYKKHYPLIPHLVGRRNR
jgi:hypothetical protein